MKKLILVILFLPSLASAQWSGVWVSGGGSGSDTTGIHASIVHNATLIRGKPVTLIAPADNQILKYDSASDSLLFEEDASSAGGSSEWTDFGTFLKPNDAGDVAIHIGDTADNDSLIIAVDGSGNVTFTTTTGNIIWTTGNTGDAAFQVPASSISLTNEVIGTLPEVNGGTGDTDLDDIIGGTAITVTAGANTIIAGNATIAVTAGAIGTTQIGTDGVSADELNATGVEAELEAVLDLPELQGLLTSIQVDSVGGNGIVTNATGDAAYLQLSAILDTLNNHDGAVLFTQGNTALATDAVTPAILDDGSDTPADEQLLSYESTGDEVNYQDIVDFVTAGNRIQVTGTTNITIASADTGEIQLPAALWDTTASTNGTLDFLETGAYRIKYWEFAASTQDTLLMTCDVNFTIPQDFGSWLDVKFEYENESTGADTLIMRMEGIAHDEVHAADLTIGSAPDTLVSPTGPAANDLRQSTAQTTITGTFAPEDHVHLILYRPATDAGVIRFLKLTFRYLKS